MVEVSDKRYWRKLNYHDGILYCSMLEIEGKDNWRMIENIAEYWQYRGYEYWGGYHGIWREVPDSNKWYEDDKKYTAFSSPLGLHEYNRLPQGLCNSPASFMRMMLSIFGDQNFLSLLCYLDDLLCITKASLDDHLNHLRLFLTRLQEAGLKINAENRNFVLRKLNT